MLDGVKGDRNQKNRIRRTERTPLNTPNTPDTNIELIIGVGFGAYNDGMVKTTGETEFPEPDSRAGFIFFCSGPKWTIKH